MSRFLSAIRPYLVQTRVSNWLLWSLSLVFLYQNALPRLVASGPDQGPPREDFVLWAAGLNALHAVFDLGEWWRLWSSTFLHGSILHFIMNAIALVQIGPLVEQVLGRQRILFAWFLTGGVASLASLAWGAWRDSEKASLGASGAICGLLGLLTVHCLRRPEGVFRAFGQRLLWVGAQILVIGLVFRFIDNAAHIGGFACGALLGRLYPVFERPRVDKVTAIGAPLLAAAGVLALAIACVGAPSRLAWVRSFVQMTKVFDHSERAGKEPEEKRARLEEIGALTLHPRLEAYRPRLLEAVGSDEWPRNSDLLSRELLLLGLRTIPDLYGPAR